MRTSFGHLIQEGYESDPETHSRLEYAQKCPYCRQPEQRVLGPADGVVTRTRPSAKPSMPLEIISDFDPMAYHFKPEPTQLNVDQRMAQLQAQYDQQAAQYRQQVEKLAELQGLSRSGLYAALTGKRR